MSESTPAFASHVPLGSCDAVEEARRNLDRHPPGDADRPRFMKDLGTALETRFEQLGDLGSLEEAIELYRQTLDLHSTGHPDRSSSLNTLANALWTRFEKLGDPDSLTSAVELHRQALHLRPTGHSDRSSSLNNLAGALWTQFGHLGDHDSLAEAIDLHRQALELCPPGHAHHSASLNNLANTMQARFEQIGDLDSLAEAVKLHRQALALRPPGHPLRSSSLNNLANAVQIWFAQNGDLDSLTEAIELLSQALELRPPGHPDRAMSLNNLASALQSRFERLGELDSLGDAIELHRQALHLQPPGHHLRSLSLNNLANALWTRFEQLKDLESLTEAVGLHRQALALRPPGHPLRSSSLHNLALTLLARYTHLDDLQSLAEAVELHRHALTLCPPGHALRPLCLSNLANTLQKRFKQLGEHGPLTEAVELHRQALDLRPPGHPDRLMSLMNLAFTLRIRSQQPDDKGENSGAQSTRLYRVSDLVQELSLYKEGLQLCANGQPLRTRLLFNTGECMLVTGAPVFDFAEGVGSILAAMQDGGCSARESLRDAIGALRVIEVAYRSLSEHPLVIGRHIQDNPILQVYKLAIRLLPRVASFGLSHDGRLRELSGAEAISRDAATRAIAAQRPTDAVEMLEESRGVFWSQALRLRTRNLDLLPSQDAQELRRLFRLLNVNTADNESTTSLQRERLVEQRRRLSTAAEALIADIRSRPGMSRFLLPPAFSSLVQALPEGFTVFLNVSELGHHALVMDGIAKSVHSLLLRLPSRLVGNTQKKSQKQKAKMRYHDGELPAVDLTQSVTEQFRAGVRDRATFGDSLAELWICIVKPIIDLLQLKKSSGWDRPRFWWCATHNLTFLPIHAAGGYTREARERSGAGDECASDYIVSSYITSISALVRARNDLSPMRRSDVKGYLVHEGSPGRGWSSISKVKDEVRRVEERFDAAGASLTVASPTLHDALTFLKETRVHILHLACHGAQKNDPLTSAFILRDDDLTIQSIMQLDLDHASLAFLSACQTAKGNLDQPDQAVHLAASMLFCGFKSVIATMWGMSDKDGPLIADYVYEALFKEDVFDLNLVPYALDDAVRHLRERKVDAERWSVFMHMGA